MNKLNGLVVVSLMGLVACGGGGGGKSNSNQGPKTTVLSGVFKDSNVSGLAYESGAVKGLTDANGTFKYEEDSDVSFNIGGIDLGTVKGKPVITPIDLVTDGILTTPEVINKVRFLMMLDKDNMPDNGIEISKEVQEVAKNWSAADFTAEDFPLNEAFINIANDASAADGIAHPFPDQAEAIAHLKSTLSCVNAGAFKGIYSGTENGKIALTIDPVSGEVNGSSYNPENDISTDVISTNAIDFDSELAFISSEVSAKVFEGTVKNTENIEGAWSNISDAVVVSNGSFEALRFGSSSDSVFRYLAHYKSNVDSNDKGIFTFNIDAANKITGKSYSVNSDEESDLQGNIDATNQLTATSDKGDAITGFIDPDTLKFTSGVWINGQTQSSGSFFGSGCKLN